MGMNETATAQAPAKFTVVRLPNTPLETSVDPQAAPPRPRSWFWRRLLEAGFIEMETETSTKPPPGFFVNWTTVTSLVVVVSAIVGLWYFTWQTAEQRGFEKGRIEAEKQQMQRQIDEQARKLADTERLLKLAVNEPEKKNGSK